MKQNITKEQLSELSDKGIKNLSNWCATKNYFNPGPKLVNFSVYFTIDDPLLSIGQMIEFLADDREKNGMERHVLEGISSPYDWAYIDADMFCDALWKEVKEVLEE